MYSLSTPKRLLKSFFSGLLVLIALIAVLVLFRVIWWSPPYYQPDQSLSFTTPIMDMPAYDTFGNHTVPYFFEIQSGKGGVLVAGIAHTKDPEDPQFDTLNMAWNNFQPTVALVESRLGLCLAWFKIPVKLFGENGETARLAKNKGIPLYTWEPDKESEIQMLLAEFPAKQLALFYSLRPYFSNIRFGKPADPDAVMQTYIDSRTDHNGLRGLIPNVEAIDSIWQKDFPNLPDWRDTSDEWGWPEGYLSGIANRTNMIRDIHLVESIVDLTRKGERVFATMGASHAFRIEKTLKEELK